MDVDFLNKHRLRVGQYRSTDEDGCNGAFSFSFPGEARRVFCIASDGTDPNNKLPRWKHVSVSFGPNRSTPSWDVMCKVKELFWDPEEVVMQLHPPRSQWISNHPGCLHLWQPLEPGVSIPCPPGIMVGLQSLGETL